MAGSKQQASTQRDASAGRHNLAECKAMHAARPPPTITHRNKRLCPLPESGLAAISRSGLAAQHFNPLLAVGTQFVLHHCL
jgi:hypothetical protein